MSRRSTPPARIRAVGFGALVLALAMALAACGSRVSPEDVARAQGLGNGTGTGVGTGEVGSDPGLGDTGSDTGTGTDTSGSSGTGSDAGSSGTGTGSGTTGSGGDTGAEAADGGVKAGSCTGLKNTTGITDDKIVLGNVADISGPVPGLFQAAQDATKAFIAYYNKTNPDGLCGRTLALNAYDARSDSGGDQQAYAKACDETFATIGSVSSQDQGGASTAAQCGLPDMRAFTVTPERTACATCFSAYSVKPNIQAQAISDYIKKTWSDAGQHIGIYYVNVPAAKTNAESFAAGFEKQGLGVAKVQGIDTSEFNYAPYAQQMKSDGIGLVMYFGPYQFTIRLQQAMQQQGVDAVFLTDPTVYDANYVEQGGDAVDKTYVYSVIQLFDNTKIPEMVLYRQWLDQVAPGSVPNYYGLFAWSAARLFVQEATKLGGQLTRASLVAAFKKVDGWTSNGITAPMHIGAKSTPNCVKFLQLNGSSWKQVSPGDFLCGPTYDSGVGG